jgi:hypothetical protein
MLRSALVALYTGKQALEGASEVVTKSKSLPMIGINPASSNQSFYSATTSYNRITVDKMQL